MRHTTPILVFSGTLPQRTGLSAGQLQLLILLHVISLPGQPRLDRAHPRVPPPLAGLYEGPRSRSAGAQTWCKETLIATDYLDSARRRSATHIIERCHRQGDSATRRQAAPPASPHHEMRRRTTHGTSHHRPRPIALPAVPPTQVLRLKSALMVISGPHWLTSVCTTRRCLDVRAGILVCDSNRTIAVNASWLGEM